MRLWAVFTKSLREQWRNPLIPLLTLSLAPFFVLLLWFFFPSGGSTTYSVAVVNAEAGQGAVDELAALTYGNGQPILELREVPAPEEARALIEDHRVVAFVEFPDGFTAALAQAVATGTPAPVTLGGDLSNPLYPVALVLLYDGLDRYAQQITGQASVLKVTEVAVGGSGTRTEFETYVPGVLIFAIGLMVFAAAMAPVAEVESHTLHRLALTRVRAFDLLGGISLTQLLLGLAAGALALITAAALGFTSAGPLWPVLPIWVLTSIGVIGLGLIVAAFTRTVAQAFLLANFPFAVFMFLAGTMFPVRGVTLFTLGDQPVNLLDVLPPRHAVNALSKVFTFGSTDLGYEISMLTVLSLGYFALGAWLFQRRHLRTAS